jgi:hypothetical protein
MTLSTIRALAVAACLAAAAGSLRASEPCARACLEKHIDSFLAAMVAHNPGSLPLTRDFRWTENGQGLRLGDGLWNTISGPGKYKLYMADTESGQAGFFGTVFENGTPVSIALRLKVDCQLIAEGEMIVARPNRSTQGSETVAGERLEKVGRPRAQFSQVVPAAERMSREDLTRVANSYFTGLAGNTGRDAAPFWDSCVRWENGRPTTGHPNPDGGYNVLAMGCREQQESGFFPFVTSIRNRRYPLVDRERGQVLSFSFFEHTGAMREIRLPNGKTVPSPVTAPLTYQIAELFQIRGGKIDQIEAVIDTVPYGMTNDYWDE